MAESAPILITSVLSFDNTQFTYYPSFNCIWWQAYFFNLQICFRKCERKKNVNWYINFKIFQVFDTILLIFIMFKLRLQMTMEEIYTRLTIRNGYCESLGGKLCYNEVI